ncbi:MAG: hypothetical protein V1911_00215 [Candidatus Micrarchaeota archaeon]
MTWSKKQIIDLLGKAYSKGVDFTLDDEQIAELFDFERRPGSDVGIAVQERLTQIIRENGNRPAPCRMKIFERQMVENKIEIHLFSEEAGQLCGPAYLDEIYVHQGNVYSVPPQAGDLSPVREQGKKACSLAAAFAALVASTVESMNSDYEVVSIQRIEELEDANIKVPQFLKKYFKDKEKSMHLSVEPKFKVEIKIS